MTSTFATNFVSSKLSKKHYLETNTQGQPLQGQVPLTYQVYSGTGNETVPYDGSDIFVLNSTLAAGALTVDFSEMQLVLSLLLPPLPITMVFYALHSFKEIKFICKTPEKPVLLQVQPFR